MFDPKKEKDAIVAFIRDYFEKNHLKGAVLGISGGKDSAVVAGLMCEAIGPENFTGLTLPCFSKDRDANGAKLVAKKFGFELVNVDLTPVFEVFKRELTHGGEYTPEQVKNADINLKPRLRMASAYYMAQLLSALKGGVYIVPGTSNACEKFVGYYTKGGDNVCDIAPIMNLTVEEVIKIGEVLGVPEEVLYRAPDDGLSGLTDEDKLGVKYSDIAKVLRGEEGVSEEDYQKIMKLHNASLHKVNLPVYVKED